MAHRLATAVHASAALRWTPILALVAQLLVLVLAGPAEAASGGGDFPLRAR